MNEFKPCADCTSPDICRRGGACGREMLAQASGLQKLAAFGAAVLKAYGGNQIIDEFDIRDLAIAAGALVPYTPNTPHGNAGFPSYRLADEVLPLLPKD